MNSQQINILKIQFDLITNKVPDEEVEFWFARDSMEPLGYSKWENFINAIRRAIESCKTNKFEPDYHFRDVRKMVTLGKDGQREIDR
jgi:DNA-damage-inducible protein D